jgi:molybdenum ABC transporter molybdate-binding protein
MRFVNVGILFAGLMMAAPAKASEAVLLHAAGSLREALTDIASEFQKAASIKVVAKFGPSGLLRDAISGGEKAAVFASANMNHPRSLASAGKASPVVLFARNELCAFTRPGVRVTGETLLERMLDPSLKLGTSTPRADPSGDYAFAVFGKAEALRPGAKAALETKALQLTGGPNSPQAPPGQNIYGMMLAQGQADIFLAYCTNAEAVRRQVPDAEVVRLPASLSVGADYGLTVMNGAPEDAWRFALYILSADGQRILARHGFAAPALPGEK